jgi:hypothetical protein
MKSALERRVEMALGAGLDHEAVARLQQISVGQVKIIAQRLMLERLEKEGARSSVQLVNRVRDDDPN